MTAFTFRPAVRENVQLLIGVAGGTGSGKTYSALRLAKGLAGGKRFAAIDTENGRMRHYADFFDFDVGDLRAPFSPSAYTEAIQAADAAGYPVIVVDSASHEHEGDGGLLDMQEAEFKRMGSKESAKMASWIKPKGEHKDFVQALLRVKAHVILCFRAAEKIEMIREDGKTKIVPKLSPVGADGWVPISEKRLPYEMTLSFLLKAERPGFPIPIKLQEQHRSAVPLDQPISEATGQALAAWSVGAKAAPKGESQTLELLALVKSATSLPELQALWVKTGGIPEGDRDAVKLAFTQRRSEVAPREPGAEG